MGFLMTLVYIYRKICEKRAKELNEQVSHSPIKKRPVKKDEKNWGKKIFFGPLLLLNEFRADLHMGEKERMTNGGGKVSRAVFYYTHPECFVLWEQDHQD